ncbi:MAG: AsmA family protein, partial [candidate division Zixibacteria bacterium]|nr:AsmA family protein [candidate division Zixibacteria bacterium]
MAAGKTKKKGGGRLFKVIIVLLVLIIAAFAAVKIFFPAEKVKAEIIKRASTALGRTVELDDVSLSIIPRLTLDLKGLRIYSPSGFPGTEFVTIDRLSCGLKLMPLLRKQFVFNQISVDHPVIRLRKTTDGRNNFTFKGSSADVGGLVTPIAAKDTLTSKDAALSAFAFDWAQITAGDIVYQDDSTETTITLSNVSLETRLELQDGGKTGRSMGTLKIPAISATILPKNLPLALELGYNADIDFPTADLMLKNTVLKINGIPFEVEATVRNMMNPQSLFARLKASGVSLEPLVAYIPQSPKFDPSKLRVTGKLDGEVEIRREFTSGLKPYLGGNLRFQNLNLGYANVSNRVDFQTLSIGFTADSVSIASQGGQLADGPFAISGAITNWKDLLYDIRLKGRYALAGLIPFLNPALNPEVSGLLTYDLTVTGQKSRWAESRLSGTLQAENIFFNTNKLSAPLKRLDLNMTFAPSKTQVNSLYLEYPGVRMNLTGELRNGFAHLLAPRKGYQRPYFDFAVNAPMVNYDVLFPTPTDSALTAARADTLPPIFIPDIEAAGTARVDTLIYAGVEITNISSDVAYKDGVITYSNGKGRVYTGSVASAGTVDFNDFRNPHVNCSVEGRDIEANDFMTRFAGLGGHLYGKLNLKGTIDGTGSELPDFVRSLTADGAVTMTQGKLVNIELVNAMAKQFGFKTFEEESLKDLATLVKIQNGTLILDGMQLISNVGDWNLDGGVAFLDKTLDLNVGLY